MEQLRFKGHIPGLDVLRGVAISMVILYHGIDGSAPFENFTGVTRWLVYLTSWGSSGVMLFYVLSGFLITGILLDSISDRNYYSKFYGRRVLRILPVYILVLIILKASQIVSWRYVLAALLFVANMASLVGAKTGEYGPLWSLAVEEQFYLLWPWMVRRLSLRNLAIFVPIGCFLSLIALVLLGRYIPHLDLKYKLWGNAPWLLAGALIAITLRNGSLHGRNIKLWIGILAAGAVISCPIIERVDSGELSSFILGPLYRLPFVLVFAAFFLLVILRNRGDGNLARQRRLPRAFSFLGYISYGLYLIHELVFHLYDRAASQTWFEAAPNNVWTVAIRYIVCFPISVLLAYLSRKYFEDLFLRVKLPARGKYAMRSAIP